MATHPVAERRSTNERAVCAALLSSEYHGLKKRAPHPGFVPVGMEAAVPVAAVDIPRLLERARPGKAPGEAPRDSERSAHAHSMRAAQHALCRRGKHAAVAQKLGEVVAREQPAAASSLRHDAYTDIDFNEDDRITKITVRSWVKGVNAEEAQQIAEKSRPPNWSRAVPRFYLRSDPVRFSERACGYVVDSRTPSGGSYDLLEYVAWDWSPQVNGGIANILGIVETTPDETGVEELIASIVRSADEEAPGTSHEIPRPKSYASPFCVSYTYELVRCIQAKFVSNWEPGGLDVDKGSFTVAWLPDTKTLYVSGDKALRYSRAADVVPGFASMLNMLAPAVTSMLMKQLAYHAFVDYLESAREPPRKP